MMNRAPRPQRPAFHSLRPALAALPLLAILAACNGGTALSPLTGPQAGLRETAALPAADARGIVTTPEFRIAIARDGDTMDSVAARAGITTDQLATLNGLSIRHRLRAGDRLALPAAGTVAGPVQPASTGFDPARIGAAIDQRGGSGSPAAQSAGVDQINHTVESGETIYSIARDYGVSVTALASWNSLGSDLAVSPGQALIIPSVPGNGSTGRIETATLSPTPGTGTPVSSPPSAAAPLPADIPAATLPESPNLGQFKTAAAARFVKPVPGNVARGYSAAPGASQNQALDFAATSGQNVVAGDAGTVSLISKASSGIGTIVAVKHEGNLTTFYSPLTDVTVKKGDIVTRGQVLGKVASRDNPRLRFGVLKGLESVDPTPYL